jgi:hypothetical protein
MIRVILLFMSIAILVTSLAFAQAGPEQKAKPKPKKKKTEEKSNLQPGERLQADTTKTKTKPIIKRVEVKKPEVKQAAVVVSNHLKRALFTTGIVKREPVDDIDSLTTDTERIYFFTEVAGLQDKTIRHRWIYDNEVRMELPIAIGGPNWRVYSIKRLPSAWTGEWTVLVVDEDGNVLGKKKLMYYLPNTQE